MASATVSTAGDSGHKVASLSAHLVLGQRLPVFINELIKHVISEAQSMGQLMHQHSNTRIRLSAQQRLSASTQQQRGQGALSAQNSCIWGPAAVLATTGVHTDVYNTSTKLLL